MRPMREGLGGVCRSSDPSEKGWVGCVGSHTHQRGGVWVVRPIREGVGRECGRETYAVWVLKPMPREGVCGWSDPSERGWVASVGERERDCKISV